LVLSSPPVAPLSRLSLLQAFSFDTSSMLLGVTHS
jgi:hypothetical protein